MRFFNPDERAEREAMWIAAWKVSNDPAVVANEAQRLLIKAKAAGRNWATHELDSATHNGLTAAAKKWRKAQEPRAFVSHDGKVIGSTNTTFSLGRRHAESGDTVYAMTLFQHMSWSDVAELVKDTDRRIDAAGITRSACTKLLKLYELYPESEGPAEATKAVGMTVDEYLAS